MDKDSKCDLVDANFAAAYEQRAAPRVSTNPTDTVLFEHVMDVVHKKEQLMAWGPSYKYW
jgi:hypothetical protein